MNTQVARIENEIRTVEAAVVQQSMAIRDTNEFLRFYWCYLAAYVPLLEFASEFLPEQSLARLANFGMLIDHISAVQLNRVLSVQTDRQARELIDLRGERAKSEITALMNDVSIAQKSLISSTLLRASSVLRDMTLCSASGRFSSLNKIVLWANVFSSAVRVPALVETIMDTELLNEATVDLTDANRRLRSKNREFDWDEAERWSEVLGLSRTRVQQIPKYFTGPKLSWLTAMEGLHTARLILNRDQEAGKSALSYNSKIMRLLDNRKLGLDEWSYRRVDSPGPCIHTRAIVESASDGGIQLQTLDSHTILVNSPDKRFFLRIPGIMSFYTNDQVQVRISDKIAVPVSQDLGSIIAFYESPAQFVCKNIRHLSTPWESDLLSRKRTDRHRIEQIIAEAHSLRVYVAMSFGGKVENRLVDLASRTADTAIHGTALVCLLYGLEKTAQASGIDVSEDFWSDACLVLAGALAPHLRRISSHASNVSEEAAPPASAGNGVAMSSQDKINELYRRLEESERMMGETVQELGDSGLQEVLAIVAHVKEILLSGLSPAETVAELKAYCASLDGVQTTRYETE